MFPLSCDVKLYNVILLGLAFMLIFTAFQTTGIIEETVIKSIKKENPDFTGSGYTSLSIIYGVLAVANWAAPSIVSVLGTKFSMLAGAVTYSFFIASFLYPKTWLLYLTSALVGFGAACLWTGQGSFLIVNSTLETIGRNSGIFWAMLQSSLLFGNLFVYLKFQGAEDIGPDLRRLVFSVLLVISCIGFVVLFFLRSKVKDEESPNIPEPENAGPIDALKRSFRLFLTRDMMLLSVTFFYTGVELGFFSGVYGAALSSTKAFGTSAKQLMGMSGIFIGFGEILGGAVFGLLGKKTNRYGRDPIIMLGYMVHIVCFYIIFVNLPFAASKVETSDKALFPSNQYLAILCSFLLGFGDSCFNTQIYSILGSIFPDNSAPAFALFKFIQSLGATAIFVYSLALTLQWHITIMVVLGTLGTMCFCLVEWKAYEENALKKSNENKIIEATNQIAE